MVKTKINSVIEVWDKDYINREACVFIEEKDKNAEIIQIEHAYEDYFMVEIVRKPIEVKILPDCINKLIDC